MWPIPSRARSLPTGQVLLVELKQCAKLNEQAAHTLRTYGYVVYKLATPGFSMHASKEQAVIGKTKYLNRKNLNKNPPKVICSCKESRK